MIYMYTCMLCHDCVHAGIASNNRQRCTDDLRVRICDLITTLGSHDSAPPRRGSAYAS